MNSLNDLRKIYIIADEVYSGCTIECKYCGATGWFSGDELRSGRIEFDHNALCESRDIVIEPEPKPEENDPNVWACSAEGGYIMSRELSDSLCESLNQKFMQQVEQEPRIERGIRRTAQEDIILKKLKDVYPQLNGKTDICWMGNDMADYVTVLDEDNPIDLTASDIFSDPTPLKTKKIRLEYYSIPLYDGLTLYCKTAYVCCSDTLYCTVGRVY